MTRRKGELTSARIDRDWPHQVALADPIKGGVARSEAIRAFCQDLTLAPRGHWVTRGGVHYRVYCFADAEHAARFRTAFGGEPFDPRERCRGRNWMRWNRGGVER